MENFWNSDWFTYGIVPLLIFISRITDVTIGTMRIVMVSKGKKSIAPILGFFEILIWLMAMGKIMQNIDNWVNYVAYAGGFATGNYIGLLIEEKLAMGVAQVRIITRKKEATELITRLKEEGYGVTFHDAQGATKKVHIVYTVVNRTNLPEVVGWIKEYNPQAFYSIEDIRDVSKGVFPPLRNKGWRKGK
ncbi:DUF2179 domain-containing protein [Prolixibacteraceae bacterium JC049]|nr:DUF2179 domain-containing protein [Prolixibacteraceae bacterium JC049]